MKKRIWELDAFRGICILGVVCVHFVYDITELFRLVVLDLPEWFLFLQKWGGILFLLLSGICATLGKRSVRRGGIVLCGGLLISLVTWGMYKLALSDISIIIYFGVLHCLGTCMILWPLFKRLPWWGLLLMGAGFVLFGFWMGAQPKPEHNWLLPFGLIGAGTATSDYFPIFPNLGYFLLGGCLGKTLYRKQESLFPGLREGNPLVRFFTFCGRQSLWIYLLHQPLLSGLCYLLLALK